MERNGIVDALGRQRRVESFVQLYAGRPLDADLKDLSQIVYMILLTMDEDKLRDLWEHNEIDFYIRRVIRTQLYGNRTEYDRDCRRFARNSAPIDDVYNRRKYERIAPVKDGQYLDYTDANGI